MFLRMIRLFFERLNKLVKKPVSEIIQYDVAKEEASLYCVYLTEEEQKVITGP